MAKDDEVISAEARIDPIKNADPADPEHGVRPLGQSQEWRDRLIARERAHKAREAEVDADKPDVLLDFPDLSVEEISLEVNNVEAHVSVDAKVSNLVQLSVGADVEIERVSLLIKGVHAEVLLKARLEHVGEIVDRALTSIDRNPQLISQLITTIEKTVTTVGDVAKAALAPGGLLSQTVNTLGQTVQHVVDTTGRIVEQTLNPAGQPVSIRQVGDLGSMTLLSESTDPAGNMVREVETHAGDRIQYIQDRTGAVRDVKVLGQSERLGTSPAPGSPPKPQEMKGARQPEQTSAAAPKQLRAQKQSTASAPAPPPEEAGQMRKEVVTKNNREVRQEASAPGQSPNKMERVGKQIGKKSK